MTEATILVPGRVGEWPVLQNPDAYPSLLKFSEVGNYPDKERGTHVVYFLYCAGFIKIGMTKHLRKRVNDLQMCAPWPVHIVGVLAGGRLTEDYLHSVFREHSVGGEWFRLGDDLRHAIVESAPDPIKGKLEEADTEYMDWIAFEAERIGLLPASAISRGEPR